MLKRESGENPELARSGKGNEATSGHCRQVGSRRRRPSAPKPEDLPKFVFRAERNRPRSRCLRELKDLMSKTLLAAALLPTAAFAQQMTIPVNPTMVVTANRVEQPASVLAPSW